ncbi:hypothetical protein lerEdw1_020950 [Lerista edwardsae]|nr:hypothetical protein lerEdw1_020950 [Lerista edwardsae]
MARLRLRLRLACALLLAFASWSLCSDSEEEMKALEADLLTNMYTSKHSGHWRETAEISCFPIANLKSNPAEMEMSSEQTVVWMSKAKVPQWKMTLLNICDLLTTVSNQDEEAGEPEDTDLAPRRPFPAALDGFSLEALLTLYQLQKVCHSRTFQQWELLQQDIYDPENSSQDKDLMKRKTPYILKRQLHVNKARRPYILKRSPYY